MWCSFDVYVSFSFVFYFLENYVLNSNSLLFYSCAFFKFWVDVSCLDG